MTFTHKIVHANDRDEIWTRAKTNDTLNPDSNDPVTAKAVVEYVEEKLGGGGDEAVTMDPVNEAITTAVAAAIAAIPKPVPEKVKTWVGLQCFNPASTACPLNTTDFDIRGYCIMVYHNVVIVHAWLVTKRRLYEVYGEDAILNIGEIYDAILKPIVLRGKPSFPFVYLAESSHERISGSFGVFEFEDNGGSLRLLHLLDWKSTSDYDKWKVDYPTVGTGCYYGSNTPFNAGSYAYDPTNYELPPNRDLDASTSRR
jgi:hypothetical protein